MKKLRILLADDHRMIREGLRLVIDAQPDLKVVGEAADGEEVLRQARLLTPDLVVMDLSMPGCNGLEATTRLKAEFPAIRILILTANEDEQYLRELCKAGAAGYLLKRSAADELVKAIGNVARGGLHFESSLAARLLLNQARSETAKSDSDEALSPRERDVLRLLAWGHSNKEIAGALGLSVKTVETYKVRIATKLGLRSRTEMVRFALRQGWLDESHLSQ
jgi:DNA-binding NarL/FixJ family response regulator